MTQNRHVLEPDKIYHIWTHANGNENLFRSHENYVHFLEKYKKYLLPVLDTYAYCLMPNHIHIMLRIKSEEEILLFLKEKQTLGGLSKMISLQFSHFFNSYTQSYNKSYERKGSLFIPNFRRKEICDEAYFSWLIIYIHKNPIHHRFVKNLEDWKFSSYKSFFSKSLSNVNKQAVLDWFGGIEAFREFHKLNVNLDTANFLEST